MSLYVKVGLYFAATSLLKLYRGGDAEVGSGAGNQGPDSACLPVTCSQATWFSGPLQWLENRLRSQLQLPSQSPEASRIQAFVNPEVPSLLSAV